MSASPKAPMVMVTTNEARFGLEAKPGQAA
jgi:hypothetical protein